MADRSTDLFFEDSFNRADNTAVGNGWATNGNLQIKDNVVRQTGSGGNANARMGQSIVGVAPGIGNELQIGALFAITDVSASRYATILVGPDSNLMYGYGLKVKYTSGSALDLKIIKQDNGTDADLIAVTGIEAEAETDGGSALSVFQRIAFSVRHEEGATILEAYLNDEERPRLTFTDRKHPVHQQLDYFGFRFGDTVTSEGYVYLKHIAIQALSDKGDDFQFVPDYYTFGKLKSIVRSRALRDSNSLVDDEFFGDLLNEAQQEAAEFVGRPSWLSDVHSFVLANGTESYELPGDTAYVDDVVWDTGQQTPVRIVHESDYRRTVGSSSSGRPYVFRVDGRGPDGGLLLKGYPKTDADRAYEVRRFRSPSVMLNNNDIPDVPQSFAYSLIWGALLGYSMRDSDRTHIQAAAARWESSLRRMRHAERKLMQGSTGFILTSGVRRSNLLGNTAVESSRYGSRRF